MHPDMRARGCGNCGCRFHSRRECRAPLCSFGIACVRDDEVLVVQRRDSFGFLELLRGRYDPRDVSYLRVLAADMTDHEKMRVEDWSYEKMWADVFGAKPASALARCKFATARDALIVQMRSMPSKPENEWEFPKGRRERASETDVQCARREFEEETCVSQYAIRVRVDGDPIVEEYKSFDGRWYRNTFFVATPVDQDPDATRCRIDPSQAHEIGRVKWVRVRDLPVRLKSLLAHV